MFRREYLGHTGRIGLTTGVVGAALLAGCSTSEADERPRLPTEPSYGGWFDGVTNYDRTIDLRGEPTVEIRVGSTANGGRLGYGPAAVAVSPGTRVTWRWTGKGGAHDVREVNDAFRSTMTAQTDHTFEHTFDAPGVYRYYCTPHRGAGMRGAVFVALEE